MQIIRAIIIDDERYACERLKKLLSPFNRIEVLDYFTSSEAGFSFILRKKPELVFLDIELENGVSGFDIINRLESQAVRPYIILVTAYPHYSIRAIKHRVFDYIVKPVDIDELTDTINRFLNQVVSATDSLKQRFNMLSAREMDVLRLVMGGKSSAEIAEILYLSPNTVNTHRRNILKKTGARSALDLLRMKEITDE